jgi:homoserine O-acetyltransferase/O-succinyltransferase
VPKGRAVTIPFSDQTRGHGSHTIAALWKGELERLLKESAK